jgi:hypothetical protein
VAHPCSWHNIGILGNGGVAVLRCGVAVRCGDGSVMPAIPHVVFLFNVRMGPVRSDGSVRLMVDCACG